MNGNMYYSFSFGVSCWYFYPLSSCLRQWRRISLSHFLFTSSRTSIISNDVLMIGQYPSTTFVSVVGFFFYVIFSKLLLSYRINDDSMRFSFSFDFLCDVPSFFFFYFESLLTYFLVISAGASISFL